MDKRDQVQEVHYEKAVLGARAQMAMEELRDFLTSSQDKLLTSMRQATTKEEAWAAATKFQAYHDFVSHAQSAIYAGAQANKSIKRSVELGGAE